MLSKAFLLQRGWNLSLRIHFSSDCHQLNGLNNFLYISINIYLLDCHRVPSIQSLCYNIKSVHTSCEI